MKVKCTHCGYEVNAVNNKCPHCNSPLSLYTSRQLNRKIYIAITLIIIVVIAGLAYRHWNNHSSGEQEEVAIKTPVVTTNTNNSSDNIVVNKLKEPDETNKNQEETQTCIRLSDEMNNMVNENIALAKRRQELYMQYVDIVRGCTRDNLPQSVCQERTQYVQERIKEVDVDNSLLGEKEIKNEEEKRINKCK